MAKLKLNICLNRTIKEEATALCAQRDKPLSQQISDLLEAWIVEEKKLGLNGLFPFPARRAAKKAAQGSARKTAK